MAADTTIEIDVRELAGLPEEEGELRDLILSRAASMLIDRNRAELMHFNNRLKEITDEEIRAHIRPALEDAMERALHPTDFMGVKRKDVEPITLREFIVQKATVELKQGSDNSRHLHSGSRTSVIEEIISKHVSRALMEELMEPMKVATDEVASAVRAEAATILAEALKRSMARLAL